MTKSNLDPALASILDSIRATVGGEPGPTAPPEKTPQPVTPATPATPQPVQDAQAAPAAAPVRSVEDFLAELARPHVKAWVEANLPEIVQRLAAEEIRRLTGNG